MPSTTSIRVQVEGYKYTSRDKKEGFPRRKSNESVPTA